MQSVVDQLYYDKFCHHHLQTQLRQFWLCAVWSDQSSTCSFNEWCAVCSVHCVLWSVQLQIHVHMHMQVQVQDGIGEGSLFYDFLHLKYWTKIKAFSIRQNKLIYQRFCLFILTKYIYVIIKQVAKLNENSVKFIFILFARCPL